MKEWKATGPTYRTTLCSVIRNSCQGYYRRMIPALLAALEFRSNNERHHPVIDALDLVQRFGDTKMHTFPADENVPLDGVVRGLLREAVVEKDAAGRDRLNRIPYEIAVLEACASVCDARKSGWLAQTAIATQWTICRPTLIGTARTTTVALSLPLDAEQFIAGLKAEMREALTRFDAGLKKNPCVRQSGKDGDWITLTPLDAQPDPPKLAALKAELNAQWPMSSLLDIVKKTDLRLASPKRSKPDMR